MKKSVLLVDDDAYILDIYRYLLDSGYLQLFSAASGQEALKLLQQERIDLMVADMEMPDGNGAWLMQHLPYPVKTIIVSGLILIRPEVADSAAAFMSKDDFLREAPGLLAPDSPIWE